MADLPQLPSPADYEDVGASDGQAPADNKESVFEGILETLQHNNFVLNEVSESADIIEENTTHDESETERRNRRINEENTDKPGAFSKAIGGLGAGVKGVGGILNKANPFQEGGLGTKMSILLISGVLFAISKFGDKLIKPLASVLEMFDGEGGVLDKIKNSDMFKGVLSTFEKIGESIKAKFETIGTDIEIAIEDAKTSFNEIKTTISSMGETIKSMGDDIEKLMESVTLVGGYAKQVYDMINAYVMQFDTKGTRTMHPTEGVIETGDGKLDAFEMKNLKEDLEKKVFGFMGNLVDNIVKGLYTFMGASVVLAFMKGAAYRFGRGKDNGPDKRSSRGNRTRPSTMTTVLKRAATFAVAGSVGATAQAASLKPGQAINKAGSIYDKKTGKIVKTAKNVSYLSKYPRLMKVLRLPFIGPIIAGVDVKNTLNNEELSDKEKKVEIGGHIAAGMTSAMFGALGASLGLTFGPPGAIIGGILGSLVGYGLGDMAGQELAGWLLGEKRAPIPLQSSGTLGEMNASTGDVQAAENLPISKITSASSGEYPQANAVSQLQGSLMNRNTDLALAAYEADKAANLKINTNPLPGGRGDAPISMPVLVDKGQVTNIQSNYGSTLSVDNGNRTSRLFTDSLLIDVRSAYAGQ